MKILILTTETPHHVHFVEQISLLGYELAVIKETDILQPSYDTSHSFEATRDRFEINNWFNGVQGRLEEFADVYDFERINQQKCVNLIKKLNPSVTIVFGTQILNENVIRACNNKIFNLHGGDPTKYRGLDSHLWAIWHDDFDSIVTTLHQVEKTFDTGAIFELSSVPMAKVSCVSQLRYWNTQVCVEMSVRLIETIALGTAYTLTPQTTLGRYYSFMPGALKQACVSKFEKWRGGF